MKPVEVLILDDKQENIIALEALIRDSNLIIHSTTSPNDALKICWSKNISIALVDVQMPEMDGFEFVSLLKSNPKTKEILVIFVTAIADQNIYKVKGFQGGAIDYLHKPLDPNITKAKLSSFIKLAQTQNELKEKNNELEKYFLILKNSADLIIQVPLEEQKIEWVNPASYSILGIKPELLKDKYLIDFIHSDYHIELINLFKRGYSDEIKECSIDLKINDIKGDLLDFNAKITFKNKIAFMILRKIESHFNLDHAKENNKQKSDFLAQMSHEIRTPISSIISISNILKETSLNDEQVNLLRLIESSGKNLLGLVNDILDLSKLNSGEVKINSEDTNLKSLLINCADTLRFKAQEKGIYLKTEIDDKIPARIKTDPLRINQIVNNLLSNAIKFTSYGGVTLKVALLNSTSATVKIAISVIDSGIGIHPDKQKLIFEPFVQADHNTEQNYGGTGLGLSIVRKIGELLGGKIELISEPGNGSEFIFTNEFQVSETLDKITSQTNVNELIPFKKDLIFLLAEDNPVNQFATTHVLKRWNIKVDIASDGEIAKSLAFSKKYDLILMDTHMPVMNGPEVAEAIRHEAPDEFKNTPIISMSAAVLEQDLELAIQSGMNDSIGKPFDPIDLYKKITQYVNVE